MSIKTMFIMWLSAGVAMCALSAYTNNPWWALAYLGGSGVGFLWHKWGGE